MKEVMRCEGGNDFKIPHLKKQASRRAGNVVSQLGCDSEILLQANAFIDKCYNA